MRTPTPSTQDEDSGQDDGVPEEVALAYATYQSAKDRYRNQMKNRGYQGERDKGDTKDFSKKTDLTRDEKVKLMKSRSFCSSCGKKGHWHRDPECPSNTGNGGTRGIKEVEVCHHVAAEVFSLRHEGTSLLGITDTACAKAVAGTMWLQQYSDAVEKIYRKPELHRESEAFRFGTGKGAPLDLLRDGVLSPGESHRGDADLNHQWRCSVVDVETGPGAARHDLRCSRQQGRLYIRRDQRLRSRHHLVGTPGDSYPSGEAG